MKITRPALVLALCFWLLANHVLALEDIGYSKIHPASPLYFLKGVREKLELHFAQTYRVKEFRQLEFATRRLREVRALIPISQDLIPSTMERYIAHLSKLTDKHQENDKFVPILQHNLSIHLRVLENIYNQTTNSRAKMFIRSAMNRVMQRADVPRSAKLSICNFFTKEASSSALNQTEQFVLQNRAQDCRSRLTSDKIK